MAADPLRMSTRRRLLRATVAIVATGAVALAGLAGVSQTRAFHDWLRRQVLTRLNAQLLGRVDVRRLDGNLFGALVLTDVRVTEEGRRVLAIRRIAATYDLATLLRGGGLRITTLAADGVALQLVEDERGWNVERLTPPTNEPSRIVVDLRDLRVRNAAVRVLRPGRSWRLRDVEAAGAAHVTPDAMQIAIARLSFIEQGSRVRVTEAAGRLGYEDETWRADDVVLRTAGSRFAARGTFAATVDGELQIDRLAGSEVRALLRTKMPVSDWQGRIAVRGPRAGVAVSGELQATAADEAVGQVRLAGTVDLRPSVPVGALRAALERVDLAGIGGAPLPSTDLTGTLDVATRADAPRVVEFVLDLTSPRVATTTLASLQAHGQIVGDDVRFDADVASGSGSAHASGVVTPSGERFDVRATARDLDPGALTGRPELAGRVTGTATLAGSGFAPAKTSAALTMSLDPSRIGGVTIREGAASARAAGGRLTIERAAVTTSAGTAEVSGDLALDSDASIHTGGLRATARATDLRPLATLLGRPDVYGTATVDATARGSARAFDATAELAARGVGGSGWQAADVRIVVSGTRVGTPEAAAELHGNGHDVVLGARRLTDAALTASWHGDLASARADFDLQARENDGRHQIAGTVTRSADATTMALKTLRFDQHGDTWTAVGTPTIVQRGERVAIDGLALRSARGALHLQGTIGGGANDLDLVVDGLDLEALAGLVPDQVRGRLGGRAHLGGSLATPRLDADLALAGPTLAGTRYDDLRARIAVADARGELHGRLAQGSQTLLVDGAAGVEWSLAPARFMLRDAQARMRADGIDVGFIGALWPGFVTKLGGTISGDLTLTGSLAAPEARGRIALAGGHGYVVPLGVTYEQVDLAVVLDGRAASIERLAVQSGKGRLEGGGSAHLGAEGATMNAQFEVRSFPLFSNQYGRGAASGWLWISGTTTAPVLEGSLETDDLVIQIPETLATSVRPPDPTIMVVGPGAPPPAPEASAAAPPPTVPTIFDRAALTVQVDVPRNAWIRRSDANVELKGWMTAWKKPGEELRLAGDIRGVRGWYAFQGKKFTLVEGSSVRFGGQSLDPVLDITATHPAGEYLVRLRVGGTVTKPTLTLESEPALDQADVLSVLLFGTPTGQLTRSQSAGLREQALGIAGGYVASELRQSVANALGVDDLQFDTGTTGLQDARVSVGKYVADDIFVSLAHRFGQTAEELRVEWTFCPQWSLETSTDTLGRSGVDVFWKRRY